MNIKNWSKLNFRLVALIYTLGISYISLIPLNDMHLPNFNFADKIVHFLLYFFMSILWLMAYPCLWKKKKIYFIVLVAWGIMIEILQANFVQGRSGEILDVLFNTAGILFGFYINYKFAKKIIIKKKEI